MIVLLTSGNELEQAKKCARKTAITDIAIKKVRYIKYKDLTDEQNAIMQRLAKEVLFLSQTCNNSNEVAITCDLGSLNPLECYGICLGDGLYRRFHWMILGFLWQTEEFLFWLLSVIRVKSTIYTKTKSILRKKPFNCSMNV